MRKVIASLLAVAVVAGAFVLTGCQSDCGLGIPPPPDATFRWPVAFDRPDETIASPRRRVRRVVEVEEIPAPARFTQRVGPCDPPAQRFVADPCLPNGTDARTPAVR